MRKFVACARLLRSAFRHQSDIVYCGISKRSYFVDTNLKSLYKHSYNADQCLRGHRSFVISRTLYADVSRNAIEGMLAFFFIIKFLPILLFVIVVLPIFSVSHEFALVLIILQNWAVLGLLALWWSMNVEFLQENLWMVMLARYRWILFRTSSAHLIWRMNIMMF